MKKSLVSLCMWSIALIVVCGGASPSLAQDKGSRLTWGGASPSLTQDKGSRLTWGGASPSLQQAEGLNKYRGEWGCSIESPTSFFGPLAGLALLALDRDGNIHVEETVASADPFAEIATTFDGRMILQANGALRGTAIGHVTNFPGLPDLTYTLMCVGMDTQGGQYREMRCLDLTDEPGTGATSTDIIGLLTCKKR
jgi:hypothetical protein